MFKKTISAGLAGLLLAGCAGKLTKLTKIENVNDPYLYYNGVAVPFDLKKAFALADEQCNQNNLESCFLKAYMLYYGEGVKQNKEEANKIFEKSCNGIETEITRSSDGGTYKQKFLQDDKTSCYFVAKKAFEDGDYIKALKKNNVYKQNPHKPMIVDKTDITDFSLSNKSFKSIPLDDLFVYSESKDFKLNIPFQDKVLSFILLPNIEANKKRKPKDILAYYDYLIKSNEQEKVKDSREKVKEQKKRKFFLNKNKGVYLESIGRKEEALKIYQENCLASDNMSCVLYKGLKVRGGNF